MSDPSPAPAGGGAATNQCDGCRQGLPLREGIHWRGDHPFIGCTADRYAPGPTGTAGEPTHRWNVEETDEGVRLCRGGHERAASCEWEYFAAAGAAPGDGPTADFVQVGEWMLPPESEWGRFHPVARALFPEIAKRDAELAALYEALNESGASPAVREAAKRVLVQVPAEPEPDPETGEYSVVYLSVTAPIWAALDALRAALAVEGEPAGPTE